MQIDVSFLISIISVVAAITFGYIAMRRAGDSNIEESASMNARVLTKLDMISDDIKDMKRDNQDLRHEVTGIKERVLILEQRVNVKKGRIDE